MNLVRARSVISTLMVFMAILALAFLLFFVTDDSDLNSPRCSEYSLQGTGPIVYFTYPVCIGDLNAMIESIAVTLVCMPCAALKVYIDRRISWVLSFALLVMLLALFIYLQSWHQYGNLLPNLTGPNPP